MLHDSAHTELLMGAPQTPCCPCATHHHTPTSARTWVMDHIDIP
jgi:hypothetical protein